MRKIRFGRAHFALFVVMSLLVFTILLKRHNDISQFIPAPAALHDLPVLWRLIVAVGAACLVGALITVVAELAGGVDVDRVPLEDQRPSTYWLVYAWSQVGVAVLAVILGIVTLNPIFLLGAVVPGGFGAWWIVDYYRDLAEWEAAMARRAQREADMSS